MVEIFTPEIVRGLVALLAGVVLGGGALAAWGPLSARRFGLAHATATAQAPQTAGRSENILSGIVDNTTNGIIVLDRNSVVQAFNPAAAGIFGYQPSEIVGRSIDVILPDMHREAHDRSVRGSTLVQARVMS